MSDKKKKKSKQKQKQQQRQTQQVIVNVGGRVRRREEPRRENKLNMSAQPPPIVQYVYRDNLALNAINERMRENAITQTLMKTAQSQTQPQQAPKLAAPSPALYQQQPIITTPAPRASRDSSMEQLYNPTTPKLESISNIVTQLLDNNKIHTSPVLPTETKEEQRKMTDFYKVLSPTPPPNPFEKAKKTDINTPQNLPPNNPFKLTKDGLPYKRSKNYNEIMETYIGAIPREERNKKQQKAYEEYLNTLTKPSGDDKPETDIIDEETRIFPPREDL